MTVPPNTSSTGSSPLLGGRSALVLGLGLMAGLVAGGLMYLGCQVLAYAVLSGLGSCGASIAFFNWMISATWTSGDVQ